jgi:hypothetical protein
MSDEKHGDRFGETGWVGYLSPFVIIVPDDEEPLEVDIEEINSNSYDHGKLCRIVATSGLESHGLSMLICYDGAIAIPMLERLGNKENAVDHFNDVFCKLLIGGHMCEAVDRRDIVTGQLKSKGMIWPVDFGNSASSNLHSKLRMRVASNLESIILSKPNSIRVSEFKSAIRFGSEILSSIPNLTTTFLIRGVTEVKYRNWDLVLSNLWITVEQLIDYIWNNNYIKNTKFHPLVAIDGRLKSMKEDNRTWSASVKQEILYQRGLLTSDTVSKLYPARKARNKLVHEGKKVSESVALGLLEAIKALLIGATGRTDIPFLELEFDSHRESQLDSVPRTEDYYPKWKQE